MKKLIAVVALSLSAVGEVQAQDVKYDPVKAQIGYQTAGCMRDWIEGSLNRGERDSVDLVAGAVKMCGGIAEKFGWTRTELILLAMTELHYTPGVMKK